MLFKRIEPDIKVQLLNAPDPSVAKFDALLKSKLVSLEQFKNALLPIDVSFELKTILPVALLHPLNALFPIVKVVARLPVAAVRIILDTFVPIATVANELVAMVCKPVHADRSRVKLFGLGIVYAYVEKSI